MSAHANYEQSIQAALAPLVGKKLIGVDFMTPKECDQYGWGQRPVMLVFDDGNVVFPMSDSEGNDAGALATTLKGAETIAPLRGR